MRLDGLTVLRALLPLVLLAAYVGGAFAQATSAASAPRPGGSAPSKTTRPTAKPAWSELEPGQQQALAPLAASWEQISEAQKRKWLSIAENYDRLPPTERAKMHSRMSDWVALSPQQRAQARLNFGEAQQLSADEKKAKWAAYQALSPEEKRRLAADAPPRTLGTAAAVKPVPTDKLAAVPRPAQVAKPPRILAGPASTPVTKPMPVAPAAALAPTPP